MFEGVTDRQGFLLVLAGIALQSIFTAVLIAIGLLESILIQQAGTGLAAILIAVFLASD
jgi:hypothetical protein